MVNKIKIANNILQNIINQREMSDENANIIINNIRKTVKDYVIKNNLKSLVIGVSGGLDSAVVAALCQEKYIGVPLIGISIPMNSSNAHKEQALFVGNNYCSAFEEFKEWDEEVPLKNNMSESIYVPYQEQFFKKLENTDNIAKKAGFKVNEFPKNILKGNMKARIRMITLYDLARKTNGLVLSTDNYSEFLMGFWTICGDVGDYGPIQNIYKGIELPTIAKILGIREDIITQKPSDGLMVTEDNTDEAQLGATYPMVDAIMLVYLDKVKHAEEWNKIKDIDFVKNIVNRYNNTKFKRNGTINLTREEIFKK